MQTAIEIPRVSLRVKDWPTVSHSGQVFSVITPEIASEMLQAELPEFPKVIKTPFLHPVFGAKVYPRFTRTP